MTTVSPGRFVAWIGDEEVAIGETVAVGGLRGRVRRLLGESRVEVATFDASGIAAEAAVEVQRATVHWPLAARGAHPVRTLEFGDEAPPRAEPHERAVATTNIEAIDEHVPLLVGGTNLFLDASGADGPTYRLVRAAWEGPLVTSAPEDRECPGDYRVTYAGPDEAALAHTVAVEWAMQTGAAVLLVGDERMRLDELADGCSMTLFAQVLVEPDLEIVAETLGVGTADAQVFVRSNGRLDLSRCHSAATARPRFDFSAAEELRRRLALFGATELEPEELALLEAIDAAETSLMDE